MTSNKRQNVTSTGVTKRWERAKLFREKGGSEGTRGLLVRKKE